MSGGVHLLVLAVGVAIVMVDGRLVFRGSGSMLGRSSTRSASEFSGRDPHLSAHAAALFHLLMLGLVFLIVSVGFNPDSGPRAVVTRLGFVLLLVAAGHAATMTILSRLRGAKTGAQADRERSRPRPPPRRTTLLEFIRRKP